MRERILVTANPVQRLVYVRALPWIVSRGSRAFNDLHLERNRQCFRREALRVVASLVAKESAHDILAGYD